MKRLFLSNPSVARGTTQVGFNGQFFRSFEIIFFFFCFVVALFELVHDMQSSRNLLRCCRTAVRQTENFSRTEKKTTGQK